METREKPAEGNRLTTGDVLRVRTITGGTFYVRVDDLAAARQGNAVNVPLCDAATGQRIEELHPGRRPGDPRGRLRLSSIVSTEALPTPQVQAEPVQAQAAAPIVATTAAGLMLDPEEETEGYSASL